MCFQIVVTAFYLLLAMVFSEVPAFADPSQTILEQSMSDTLDLWRDGRYEQLYEKLAHRGKTSREQFVNKMRETSVRPACCFQKLENFKVLNEKRTEATVYARVGLEGSPNKSESCTKEFKMSHEENIWKMQLSDILSLSGASARNSKHTSRKKHNTYN
jgi:hypothetical protein